MRMFQTLKVILFACISPLIFLQIGMAQDNLSVFVSIDPQKYFVQQIGKDLVDVHVMVPSGADPHTYEPRPQQMVALSKAKLYYAIGIEFEEVNLGKIKSTNPNLKVVHTDEGIQKIAMAAHHHNDKGSESHDEEEHNRDHHEHTGLDPHIWLSPPLVKIQGRAILAALQEADPAHQSVYKANFQKFAEKIDRLDADLKKILEGKTGQQFMVFHPVWGYFAHAYGLNQVPIEIEGKSPKPAQLKALIQHARQSGIRIIFVQPQFSSKSAKLIAREIDGQVAFVDPLAEDWMTNLRTVAEKFAAASR